MSGPGSGWPWAWWVFCSLLVFAGWIAEKAKKQIRDLEGRVELAETRTGRVMTMAVDAVTRAVQAETRAVEAETRAGRAETRAKEAEIEARALRDHMNGRAQAGDDVGRVVAALGSSVRRRVVSAEAPAAAGGGGGGA